MFSLNSPGLKVKLLLAINAPTEYSVLHVNVAPVPDPPVELHLIRPTPTE